jgi:RNA polymerase sigma-70 factor (ECF subfamily)
MSLAPHLPGQSTDETCAHCARLKNCAACFEELVRRFQSPLLHFLIRRIGSRHDAEDLLQETFLVAYRKLGSYQSAFRFSTWLFTIANNLATSAWRRRNSPASGPMCLVESVCDRDPLADAQKKELHGKLWDTVRELLDADAFTAMWLSYVESMPADQIGQVLGRSANATRILLHRARARLATRIDRFEDFQESNHEER